MAVQRVEYSGAYDSRYAVYYKRYLEKAFAEKRGVELVKYNIRNHKQREYYAHVWYKLSYHCDPPLFISDI
jgi:hypothetical protein